VLEHQGLALSGKLNSRAIGQSYSVWLQFLLNRSYPTILILDLVGTTTHWLNNLKAAVDIREFVNMAYEFVSNVGLTEGRCKDPISSLKSHGFDSSVALSR